MASFYLGAVANATTDYYNVHAEYPRQYAYAAHVGDSWRLTPKLTANYSLRWDYITPFKEKYNNLRSSTRMDQTPVHQHGYRQGLPGRLAFAGNKWGAASYGSDLS